MNPNETSEDRRKLVALRMSMARVAEELDTSHEYSIDNHLKDAEHLEEGWNTLALECVYECKKCKHQIAFLQDENDHLRRKLKAESNKNTPDAEGA